MGGGFTFFTAGVSYFVVGGGELAFGQSSSLSVGGGGKPPPPPPKIGHFSMLG